MANIVSVDDVIDGMTLAEPVVNNFGQTLLPSGTVINSKHIRILKTWNIRSLVVKKDENDVESEISSELINLIKNQLSNKIKWAPRNKSEEDLFDSSVLYIAKYNSKKFKLDLDES